MLHTCWSHHLQGDATSMHQVAPSTAGSCTNLPHQFKVHQHGIAIAAVDCNRYPLMTHTEDAPAVHSSVMAALSSLVSHWTAAFVGVCPESWDSPMTTGLILCTSTAERNLLN